MTKRQKQEWILEHPCAAWELVKARAAAGNFIQLMKAEASEISNRGEFALDRCCEIKRALQWIDIAGKEIGDF
jgi:hypothetical protein